jgi:putative SOS response-associated peptidase YedK
VDPKHLKALLAPYPAEEMVAWPVSPRVGSVKNNDASLIEPIAGSGYVPEWAARRGGSNEPE